jgi:hypothetical protein
VKSPETIIKACCLLAPHDDVPVAFGLAELVAWPFSARLRARTNREFSTPR